MVLDASPACPNINFRYESRPYIENDGFTIIVILFWKLCHWILCLDDPGAPCQTFLKIVGHVRRISGSLHLNGRAAKTVIEGIKIQKDLSSGEQGAEKAKCPFFT